MMEVSSLGGEGPAVAAQREGVGINQAGAQDSRILTSVSRWGVGGVRRAPTFYCIFIGLSSQLNPLASFEVRVLLPGLPCQKPLGGRYSLSTYLFHKY